MADADAGAPPAPSGYDATQYLLAAHAVRPDPVLPPPATLAYGRDVAPVLVRDGLAAADAATVRRAVETCARLLGVHDAVPQFLEAGALPYFCALAGGAGDRPSRLAALSAIGAVVAAPTPHRARALADAAPTLVAAMDAPDGEVRSAAYRCVSGAGDSVDGAEAAVVAGVLPALVRRLATEVTAYAAAGPAPTDLVLDGLRKLITNGAQAGAVEEALTSPGAPAPLLDCLALARPAPSTLAGALSTLAALAGDTRGKRAVLREPGAVDRLMDMVSAGGKRGAGGGALGVAAAAAGVVMALAVEDDGKRAVLDSPRGVDPLVDLLAPANGTPALIAAATALATVAAHPRGRAALLAPATGAVTALTAVINAPEGDVAPYARSAAARALAVITWTP
jgi:hypothetical protein